MAKTDWLDSKINDLDDEAFINVISGAVKRTAQIEERVKDGLVLIGEDGDDIQDYIDMWGKFHGVSTGWSGVDALTYGWDPGELIIMGGEPGIGKSAFIIALAVNLAKSGIMPTIVSMELTRKQVQVRAAKNYGPGWQELNILLQEEQMIKRRDFNSIIKKAKEGGSSLVIVDYLQMLKDDTDNEHREVSRIVKELKILALQHGITIVAISSLNRGRDTELGLQTKDLHGSGTIEYYADQILFLERTDQDGVIQVKVVKNRSNPLDWKDNTRKLSFDGSLFKDTF